MSQQSQEIAKTILSQMGGSNRLVAMIGAKNFCAHESGVSFRFKMSKHSNHVKITLNSMDLYDVTFTKIHGTSAREIEKHEGIYNDMLKPIFEKSTKLYLTI